MNKPKKGTKISELRTDDNESIDLTQIPNAFSKYPIELGEELCNDIPPSVTIPKDYFADFECPAKKLLYFKEISETEVLKLLHGLSASNFSIGYGSSFSKDSENCVKHNCTLTYINFQPINSYRHISK